MVVHRILARVHPLILDCYKAASARNPNLHGTIDARSVVGREGDIENVSLDGSDFPNKKAIQCVRGVFDKLSFPQPEGGIVRVRYPLRFSLTSAPGDRN